jgi:multicomponent Na+:H+ antiporter subunit D
LFSGFVSKSMVMVAALEEGHPIVWLALLFASAGVFHHAGIKIPFFTFFAHDSGIRCKEAPTNMLIAMGLAAVICVFNGSYPWVLYSMLPFPVDYAPYTAAHVLTQSQLLFFSALAFAFLKLTGLYPPELPGVNIDAEWSYRRFLPRATKLLVRVFGPADRGIRAAFLGAVNRMVTDVFQFAGPGGVLARSVSAGNMVFIAIALLAGYLVIYLI